MCKTKLSFYETLTLVFRGLSVITVLGIGYFAYKIKSGQSSGFMELNSAYLLPVMKPNFAGLQELNKVIANGIVIKNMGKTTALNVRYSSIVESPQCNGNSHSFFSGAQRNARVEKTSYYGGFPAPNLGKSETFSLQFHPANSSELNQVDLCTPKLHDIDILIYITYNNIFDHRYETEVDYSTPFINKASIKETKNLYLYTKETKIKKLF